MNDKTLNTINTPQCRLKIAEYNGKTEQTVILWIKNNHKNLTLESSLKAIEEVTGLNRNQILS